MFRKRDTLISLSLAPPILPVAWCIISLSFTVSACSPVFTSAFSAFTYCPVSGPGGPHTCELAAAFEKGTWNGMTRATLQRLRVPSLLFGAGEQPALSLSWLQPANKSQP